MSVMPDHVMVFAAGLGTRMRPVTNTMPKPMIPIAGRPMLDHMLDRFAAAGVANAIVNVHYLGEQIIDHVTSRTQPKITISDERAKLLDQGGGIKKVLPQLGDAAFFICNTDALWVEKEHDNIKRLAAAWNPDTMDILMLVADRVTSIGVDWPGDFTLGDDGRLTKRAEGTTAPLVYTGVAILKPELFADETDEVFRLAPTFWAAAAKGRLHGLRLEGLWLHVGTPEAIGEAEEAFSRSAG